MSIPQQTNGNKNLQARAKEATDTILREVNRHAPEDQSGALQQLLGDWLATNRDPILRELVLGEVSRRLRLPVGSLKQLVKPEPNLPNTIGCVMLGRLYTLKELRALREHQSETAEESLPLFGLKGIIRKGRTHLLAGKPRVGKTETLFRGGMLHWHNERVLYLSEEYEDDWSIRLSSFDEDELPEHVDIWLCAGEPREALLQKIQQGSYSVVVLDTVRGVWRLRDELHPSRVVDDLMPLISLQRQMGFTLICLHHERKAEGEAITDRFAGTNALSAMFDMLISLAPKGEDGLLLTYEGRTSKGGSLLLQWKGDELCYVGEADLVEFRTLAQRVEGIIYSAGRMLTTKEVWQELGEPRPSLSHMKNVLEHLLENGRIQREPKEERKGATYRWYASTNLPNITHPIVSGRLDAPTNLPNITHPIVSGRLEHPSDSSVQPEEDPFTQAEDGLLAYDLVSGHWYPAGSGGSP
ncbi:MAG: hypothetical protein KatS3mg023_3460 [Armatimonadota bacterium]|nr:MAG: hypothetical protein KatS3mg023_3460 [Armatimonadota bacterium]